MRTPHLFAGCATIKERYPQFVYVELAANGADHALKPVFVSHEVVVGGRALRRVKTAARQSESSWIASLAGRDRSGVPEGQPIIGESNVIAVKTVGSNDESAGNSESNFV